MKENAQGLPARDLFAATDDVAEVGDPAGGAGAHLPPGLGAEDVVAADGGWVSGEPGVERVPLPDEAGRTRYQDPAVPRDGEKPEERISCLPELRGANPAKGRWGVHHDAEHAPGRRWVYEERRVVVRDDQHPGDVILVEVVHIPPGPEQGARRAAASRAAERRRHRIMPVYRCIIPGGCKLTYEAPSRRAHACYGDLDTTTRYELGARA